MAWPELDPHAKRAAVLAYLLFRHFKGGIRLAATVVLSAAVGAAVALLVARPALQADPVTTDVGGHVRSFSAGFPDASLARIAQPTAMSGGPSAAAERSGRDRRFADPLPAASQSSLQSTSGPAAGQPRPGGDSGRDGTQSAPGGASEPPAGSAASSPVDEEERVEDGPGEQGEEEEQEEELPAEEPEEDPEEEEDGAEEATLCHKAGATNAKTITVDASAVASHLAHGDVLGACP